MRIKLKSGKTLVVPDEMAEPDSDVPGARGISMLGKTQQIREELASCLGHCAHIRATLFGEGESELSEKPSESTMAGVLHDILAQACKLRGELERTGDYLQPQVKQPKGKQVAHA